MGVCGRTYPRRLWCIWELFTLLAFTRLEQAVERLCIVSLDVADAQGSVAQKLPRFEVRDARCFDPNEEARLRQIIASFGDDAFNERIRTLGARCANGSGRDSFRGLSMVSLGMPGSF